MRPALPPRLLIAVSLLFAVCFALPVGAVSFPATGSLRIDLLPSSLAPIVVGGSFSVSVDAPLGGHVGVLALPSTAVQTAGLIIPQTDPGAYPISGLQATVLLPPGTFSGGPSFGGVLPLQGVLKVCLFAACDAPSVPANISLPLGPIGGGPNAYTSSAVGVTVTGAAWTTGTIQFPTYTTFPTLSTTRMGFAHGPASVTSSTAAPSGVISLVTPTHFRTSIPADIQDFYGFAQLDIHIVPEPASALLLGSGVLLLAAAGRRRSR